MLCVGACGLATAAVGAALLVLSAVLGYVAVPDIIDRIIVSEVVLMNETEQFERFLEVPFPLTFSIRIFNVTNPEVVVAGGVPSLQEVGPYVYKLYQQRVLEESPDPDRLVYRFLNHYEFDPEASFPLTEDDELTITNVPYMSVLQVAEQLVPNLMGVLQSGLPGVFGAHAAPHMRVRVGNLIFEGVRLCADSGLVAALACILIRDTAQSVANLQVQPDGSVLFSLFGHKNDQLSELYEVSRGTDDALQVGAISAWGGRAHLPHWRGAPCDMLNGTDSGLYPPFVDRAQPVYAFNSDICRSVELRYQHETEYEGVPAVRFAAHEWFLADGDGCFCLNVTSPPTEPPSCLRPGAMELYSCIGSYMVLTMPHFLFADPQYASGVLGVTPDLYAHRIFLDLEPNTGTPLRGAKRAQLNVFMRPIRGISATSDLRTTLTPVFWLEEGLTLPEEYVELVQQQLLSRLRLVSVAVPTLVAACAAVLLVGLVFYLRTRLTHTHTPTPAS